MKLTDLLKCPYIDKEKAEKANTAYYCTFDKMEFDNFTAHCEHCEMYRYLLRKAEIAFFGE